MFYSSAIRRRHKSRLYFSINKNITSVSSFSGRMIYVYASDIRKTNHSVVKKYIFCLYFH